ncbi:MAG: HIT family protein [Polyangiaceae bacterium]
MAETIFDQILSGKIPCHKLYEDDQVLAFLDIAPLSLGHALVIPKERAQTLDLLSDESSAALGRVLPRLCRALKRITGTSAFNVLENNGSLAHQAVNHVHFHIIPKPDEKQGLGIAWPAGKLDPQSGAELAAKIARELAGVDH